LFFDERLLKRMQIVSRPEALQRRNWEPLHASDWDSTRGHSLPVEDDLARAALPETAGEFGSF
jgi:hypothetical protein